MTSHNFQSKRLPAHHSTHPGFHSRKQQILSSLTSSDPSSRIDKSPKGSIDEAILPLIELLNRHDDYVTTSSCSGRVAIYCAGKGIKRHTNKFYASNNQVHDDIDEIDTNVKDEELEVNDVDDVRHSTKGGGRWLFVTHSHVDLPKEYNKEKLNEFLLKTIFGIEHVNVISLTDHDSDYNNLLKDDDNNRMIYFKFEPMILHVEARTLDAAKNLVTSAIDTGYRESGLLTTAKRHMVVIRSSLKLDAPIARLDPTDQKLYLYVDLSYLYLLVTLSNRKFDENSRKIKELYKTIEDHLFAGIGSGEDVIKRCTKETGKTDGNDGDVSTVDDEIQGLDNA
ncbi:6060_t:CDS:2 [Funneliformis caledonium]|uniref:tRNA(Phe) 7-[(3-amino-3-carboxypropyl)-4-demethylwyosine(37)-N(4)]-methyltransferase n=1 Tax=Funneliformis caledonium TaxID=1117310 RepID=A0A9N9F3U3_9GLOM|nr:6060_t:CDS:2 [Funneliformis caledonium]